MSDCEYVNLFQTQVKLVLDILLNVAVKEITHIFIAGNQNRTLPLAIGVAEGEIVLERRLRNALKTSLGPHVKASAQVSQHRDKCVVSRPEDEPEGIATRPEGTVPDVSVKKRVDMDPEVLPLDVLEEDLPRGSEEPVCHFLPEERILPSKDKHTQTIPPDNTSSVPEQCKLTVTSLAEHLSELDAQPCTSVTSHKRKPLQRHKMAPCSISTLEELEQVQKPEKDCEPGHNILDKVFKADASQPPHVKYEEEMDADPVSPRKTSVDLSTQTATTATRAATQFKPDLVEQRTRPEPRSVRVQRSQDVPLIASSSSTPFSLTVFSPSSSTRISPSSATLISSSPPPTKARPLHQCSVRLVDIRHIVRRRCLVCCQCSRLFNSKRKLRRHMRFHTGEQPYSCAQCPRSFALKKNLKLHLRIHSGERPHSCEGCGKRFRSITKLRNHTRFHTGEKPYGCTICGKRYRILKNMKLHMKHLSCF